MKQKIINFLPYLLFGLLGLVLMVYKIGQYPLLWYDEGARLIVSRTLAETGQYASYSVDGFLPFNPWISAGPLDVLSVAAAIALFGKQVSIIRLAIVPFGLLSMFMILIFGQKLFGKTAGWVGALLVLAVPPMLDNSFLLMSRQFMSENTSTAMALVGIFLWFRTWQTGKTPLAWLGGAILGLGMISKTQAAIWLMPALGVVWLLRLIQDRKRSLREVSFLVAASLVIVGWYLFVNLQVPAELRASNLLSTQASVRLLLLTLEPRMTSTTALVVAGVMFLVSLFVLFDLLRPSKAPRLATPVAWGQAMLAIASLFCALWFLFLSIRYPRYTYTGWIFTLMLAGWILWRLERYFIGWSVLNRLQLKHWLVPATLALLVLITLAGHGLPLVRTQGIIAVEETGQFIDENIPPEAVIETTEMEVFGLTDHWQFHFAPNSTILTATHQIFYEQVPPDVKYEFLTGDPDYLITGTFSDWLLLYWNTGLVESEFVKVAEFPPYRVFQRKR